MWNVPRLTCGGLQMLVLMLAAQTTFVVSATAAGPKLSVAQQQAVTKMMGDKSLRTNVNPGDKADKNTWYVIVASDEAIGGRQSAASGTITVELQAARASDATVVQGRRNAAIAVAGFLSSRNTAAAALAPTAGGQTQKAEMQAIKNWRYFAFATEAEAKAYLETIKPSKRN